MRAAVLRRPRVEREQLARPIAEKFDGVAHRRELRAAGITYSDIRGEIEAGRWHRLGRHTVGIGTAELSDRAKRAHAVWESGSGAVLQGVAGLHAAGLVGYEEAVIDVALPMNNRRHDVAGVRRTHYATMPPVINSSVPRVQPEFALIFAMQKAVSDRAAALLLCMTVQQRIVATDRLLEVFRAWGRCRRRALIRAIIKDVCSGAHSLGELDFAELCRRYGLPPPTRQAVRTGANGRVYLDVAWEDIGLVIEIDGGHHATALSPVLDALRQNDVVLAEETVLRVPVLGLRLFEEEFMSQVVRAFALKSAGRT
ncbi:MAG: hypothetical protein Q4G67_14990 [Actinomycetia bacterium]|nr:hypothetical protein [Actinomycetes bacterium]